MRKRARPRRLFAERLERREVLASQLIGSTLFVQGTAANDIVVLSNAYNSSGQALINVGMNGTSTYYNPSQVANIVVSLGDGNDSLSATNGSGSYVNAIDKPMTVYGGSGDDNIVGGAAADLIFGDAGHDHLEGRGGNDYLNGGDGNDYIAGGAGNDIHVGGLGADQFYTFDNGGRDRDLDYGNGADTRTRDDFSNVAVPNTFTFDQNGNLTIEGRNVQLYNMTYNGVDGTFMRVYIDGAYRGEVRVNGRVTVTVLPSKTNTFYMDPALSQKLSGKIDIYEWS